MLPMEKTKREGEKYMGVCNKKKNEHFYYTKLLNKN